MHQAIRQYEVRKKARRLVVDTWQSEANLSLFLGLIVVMTFVLPLTNLVGRHLNVYVEIAYSITLVSGVALAWRQRWMFYLLLAVGITTLVVRWACWWNPRLLNARETLMLVNVVLLAVILLQEVFAKGKRRLMAV